MSVERPFEAEGKHNGLTDKTSKNSNNARPKMKSRSNPGVGLAHPHSFVAHRLWARVFVVFMTIWLVGGDLITQASNSYAASNAYYYAIQNTTSLSTQTQSISSSAITPNLSSSNSVSPDLQSNDLNGNTAPSNAKAATPFIAPANSVATPASTINKKEVETLTSATQKSKALTSYAQLPLTFEENKGQTDAQAKFIAHGKGYVFYLTNSHAILDLQKNNEGFGNNCQAAPTFKSKLPTSSVPCELSTSVNASVEGVVLRLSMVGSTQTTTPSGQDALPGKNTYFSGGKATINATGYSQVSYSQIYPGIDLNYYGTQGKLEYDFRVAANADPNQISIRLEGADRLELNNNGELIIHAGDSQVIQSLPLLYQIKSDGSRQSVSGGGYLLQGKDQVGFKVGSYDHSLPLVIDPVLAYSSYLGSTNSEASAGVSLDSTGNVYITGNTSSIV